jgi:hypothetical protein
MKKVRFFLVAVAMVAALFISAWAAGSTAHPVSQLIILNPPGVSNVSCRTFTGPSTSYMTNLTNIKGTVSSTTCKVYLQVLALQGANQTLINEVQVSGNIGTTNPNLTIPFLPSATHKANGAYCIRLRAEGCTAGPVTLMNGNVTFNWSP